MSKNLLQQQLREVSIVVLDVETTGLNPKTGDRIIEIALLQIQGTQITGTLDQLIDPQRAIPTGATAINGITSTMVRGQPSFSQVLPQIDRLLHSSIVVGHNIGFDLRFLAAEYALAQHPFPSLIPLDTCKVAQNRFHFPKNTLEAIAQQLHITGSQYHRAMGDVQATYQIFQQFQTRLKLHTVQDWVQAQGGPIAPPRSQTLPKVTAQPRSVTPAQPKTAPGRSISDTIDLALQQQRKLEIQYAPPGKVPTLRTISVKSFDGVTVAGFCFLKSSPRRFVLKHITQATLL